MNMGVWLVMFLAFAGPGWGEKTGAGGGGGGGKQREKASGSRGDRGERDRGARGGGARGGGGGGRGQPFGDEAKLLRQLLRGYEKNTRPVANASHTIVVEINFALTQILDMDEKNQILTINVWFTQMWRDEKMTWDASDFNGLAKIRIPPDLIWRPDIVLYNGVDDYGDKVYSQCLAMVGSDGMVFWAPIANLRSTCKLDLTFFPFDDQICHFKFGSWTYDGFQVDLNKSGDLDTRQYTVNGGWDLIATKTRRNVVTYPCCPEPFPDVTFTIYLRRRTLYYIVNVVVPCLLLAGLSMLGFWLPVGTSEKVTLGLTVLLAFYVLGLSIQDRIPETSEFVPLIGVYLMVIMILTAVSVAMSVFILHIHSLGARSYRVPPWLHRLISRYLARLVGLGHIVKHRQQNDVEMSTYPNHHPHAHHTHHNRHTHTRSSSDHHGSGEEDEFSKPLNSCNHSPLHAFRRGGGVGVGVGGDADTCSRPLCEDLNARYRLIQVQGSGLYILVKDEEYTLLDKEDKPEQNDLHSRVRDSQGSNPGQQPQPQARVLKAMKAVLVRQVSDEMHEENHPLATRARCGPGTSNGGSTAQHRGSTLQHQGYGLQWHDISEILDRFFFWLSFIANTLSTMCILVVLPLSKPDPLENFEQ